MLASILLPLHDTDLSLPIIKFLVECFFPIINILIPLPLHKFIGCLYSSTAIYFFPNFGQINQVFLIFLEQTVALDNAPILFMIPGIPHEWLHQSANVLIDLILMIKMIMRIQ